MPTHAIMTKCHLIILLALLSMASACRNTDKGPSLAEYSASSVSGKKFNFEKYAKSLDEMDVQQALDCQRERLAINDSSLFQEELKYQKHYFFDPNSPFRNEEYMIPVFEAVLESKYSDYSQKEDARYFLPLFSLNRLGEKAADFTFFTKGGRTRNLYSMQSDFILLFFSNPGCENCKQITDALKADVFISQTMADGRLTVVNIYPDDDIQAWYDYVQNYPKEWISGYASDIDDSTPERSMLYYLRAIPSLYLLDRDKRVLLKDAPIEKIIPGICQR